MYKLSCPLCPVPSTRLACHLASKKIGCSIKSAEQSVVLSNCCNIIINSIDLEKLTFCISIQDTQRILTLKKSISRNPYVKELLLMYCDRFLHTFQIRRYNYITQISKHKKNRFFARVGHQLREFHKVVPGTDNYKNAFEIDGTTSPTTSPVDFQMQAPKSKEITGQSCTKGCLQKRLFISGDIRKKFKLNPAEYWYVFKNAADLLDDFKVW